MKKLLITIILLLSAHTVFAANFSELTTKQSAKPLKVIVVSITKETLTYKVSETSDAIEIPVSDIVSLNNLTSSRIKKTIILTNKTYYTGVILYQDRNKISIEVQGNVNSFNNEDIIDMVSEQDFRNEQNRSKWKAAGFSCLFPGAGQVYSNRYWSAFAFGSAFLTASALSVYSYYSSKTYWDKYEQSNYRNRNQYNKYKKRMQISQASLVCAFGVYGINIIEAYTNFKYKYDALNAQSVTPNTTTFSLTQTEKNNLYAVATYSF